MRSTAWTGSRAARGAVLGASLLAGLVVLGAVGEAVAQGMSNMGGAGYRSGKATMGARDAARPGPRAKGYGYRPGPAMKGHTYRVAPRAKAYGYRSGPRVRVYTYGPGPALKGPMYRYRPGPRVRSYGYRARPRAKRLYFRSVAPKTCGQFRYWSTEKGRCLDARTNPPKL